MPIALQMNEWGSKYMPVVDAIIMQGRETVVAKGAKTFAVFAKFLPLCNNRFSLQQFDFFAIIAIATIIAAFSQ